MKIKFISYINIFQLIKIRFSAKSFNEIYYFDISKTSKYLMRLLRLKQIVKPFEFRLAEVKDKSGELCFQRIYGRDLISVCNAIEEEIFKKSAFINNFGKMFNRENVLLYFRKIANKEVSNIVVFINVIAWYRQRLLEERPNVIEFYIETSPFFKILKTFALKEYDLIVQYYYSLRTSLRPFYLLFGNLYLSTVESIKPIMHVFKFFSRYANRVVSKGPIPLVASSYTLRGLTFNSTQRCDFPWLLMSDIPYEQVLIYFERRDMPPTRDMLSLLSQQGINSMAVPAIPAAPKELPVHSPTMKVTKVLIFYTARILFLSLKELLNRRFSPMVFLSWALYFAREFSKAFDFYHAHGIKINVDITDHDPYRVPRHLALEASGGVSISYQVSNWSITNVILGSGANIMFLFGPYYYQTLKKSGTCNNTVLFSGYMSDYSFIPVKKKSKQLSEKLMNNGAQFIICYFDENSEDERMSLIPNSRSAFIYKKLLKWVLSDEKIGLICSPKRPQTLHKRLPEIADLIRLAKDTGRCKFFEGGYTATNYPAEAAQASDIVISLLIGGTVSLESFLSGVRVVDLDLEGVYSYPEYQWGRNKIVFDDLGALITAINNLRDDRKKFDEIGNINVVASIKQKDQFRDGKASLRMGQYIHWLLEMFNQGRAREEAIEYANRKYAEIWGKENVVGCH